MSASLLNAAAMPGAAPTGAGTGIAAQAAQANQAKGPMAGFEALLAAFFGDQGLTAPVVAGQVPAGPTGVATLLTGAATTKTTTKAGAAKDALADPTDADQAAAATANAADAAATAAADAALALVVPPQPIVAAAVQSNATAAADGADASKAAPDATLTGKPAGAQAALALAAAETAADGAPVKAAGLLAQDTTAADPKAAATPLATPDAKPAAPQAPTAPASPALSDQTAATTAEALPPPAQLPAAAAAGQARAAEAQAGGKGKGETPKLARVDGARSEAQPVAIAGKTPVAPQAAAAGDGGKDAASQEHDPNAPAAAEARPASDSAQQSEFSLAANSAQAPNAAALAHAAALVRGSPQTVANLAAQIAKKLDGRTSRFDVQLDPAGLGKVDVRVEIDAAGKMTAAMNFDSQQSANELKSRAGELQRALEQAGFDMSGGMSFDVAGQGGQGRAPGQDGDNAPVFRGRAFQAALEGSADTAGAQAAYSLTSRSGVDIRI